MKGVFNPGNEFSSAPLAHTHTPHLFRTPLCLWDRRCTISDLLCNLILLDTVPRFSAYIVEQCICNITRTRTPYPIAIIALPGPPTKNGNHPSGLEPSALRSLTDNAQGISSTQRYNVVVSVKPKEKPVLAESPPSVLRTPYIGNSVSVSVSS